MADTDSDLLLGFALLLSDAALKIVDRDIFDLSDIEYSDARLLALVNG
jgi:hypothetical protein